MKLLPLFILLTVVSLFFLSYKKNAVYGDGIYYFAYLHSVVLDGDLDFKNNLPVLKKLSNTPYVESVTPIGKTANKFPFASPLLWLPLYVATHVLLLLFYPLLATGYSIPYQASVFITNFLLITVALFLLHQTLQKYFKDPYALLSVLGLFLGTNIFFYTVFDSINSHAVSFFLGAVLFYLVENKQVNWRWHLIGFVCGLLALNRTQDIILFIVPFLFIYKELNIIKVVKLLVPFVLTLSLQLLVWQYHWGSWLQSPYFVGGEGFTVFSPHLLELFTDNGIGLLWWSPVTVFLLGYSIVTGFKERNYLLLNVFCIAFLQLYLISTWSTWSQGASFGIRMFISTLPFLSYPLAQFLNHIKNIKYAGAFVITMILYNMGALFIFSLQ